MRKEEQKNRKAQVSMEYLIIIGFVTFIVIATLAIAIFYSGTIKDKIKMTQVNNFANKIVSTSESVFYAGEPSKATISVYLPENINKIEIIENTIFLTVRTSSGTNKIGFSSDVPISGDLSSSPGLKKVEIVATATEASISTV